MDRFPARPGRLPQDLVAIANKHLRILWAILAHGESYDPNAWRRHTPKRSAVAA